MRIETTSPTETMTFEALGETLQLIDGDNVSLALAFRRGQQNGVAMLGGITGVLRVMTEEQVTELPSYGYRLPDGCVERGERAYLIRVDSLMFAIGDAEFVGASYEQGALSMQVGTQLIMIRSLGSPDRVVSHA